MTVHLKHEGAVSRVILDLPPLNLLTIEVMDELIEAHQQADAHDQTRVIITESAVAGVFSNGLDPAYVLARSEEDRKPIFKAVARTIHSLFTLGKPHICKVNGPAMAGGAIVAITADFRFFDEEHGRLSFAEPKVGLPIPYPVISVIKQCCNPKDLRDVVMLARNMDASAALSAGIADGAASGAALDEMVAKQAGRLARLSPAVLKVTKQNLRAHTVRETTQFMDRRDGFEQFVGDDFLGEGLSALVENRFANFKR